MTRDMVIQDPTVASSGRGRPHSRIALLAALPLFLAACGSSGAVGRAESTPSPAAPNSATTPSRAPTGPSAEAQPGAGSQITTVEEVNASNAGGAFKPTQVPVTRGTTVRWVNHSGNIHNVTFDDRSLGASPIMYQNDAFDKAFDRPGTYHYTCTFHPGMEGTIVVS
jgi:plastocyanin